MLLISLILLLSFFSPAFAVDLKSELLGTSKDKLLELAKERDLKIEASELRENFLSYMEKQGGKKAFKLNLAGNKQRGIEILKELERELLIEKLKLSLVAEFNPIEEKDLVNYHKNRSETKYLKPEKIGFTMLFLKKPVSAEALLGLKSDLDSEFHKISDPGLLKNLYEKLSSQKELSMELYSLNLPLYSHSKLFDPKLIELVQNLIVGQVSDIFERENGFYVFRLDSESPKSSISFEKVRDEIYEALLAQRKESILDRENLSEL